MNDVNPKKNDNCEEDLKEKIDENNQNEEEEQPLTNDKETSQENEDDSEIISDADLEKMKEYYTLASKLNDDVINEFKYMDDKASKHLTSFSVITVVLALIGKEYFDSDISKNTILLLFFCIIIMMFTVSYLMILFNFIFGKYKSLEIEKFKNIFEEPNNFLYDIRYTLINELAGYYLKNKEVSTKKANLLHISNILGIITFVMLIIFVFILIFT